MSSNHDPNKYHPGLCCPTARRSHLYGALRYDTPGHTWHLAKDINWGAWSCCGGAANSPPCELRPLRPMSSNTHGDTTVATTTRGVGAMIQFLIRDKNRVLVSNETEKAWILENGRVAKKRTEGTSWKWLVDIPREDERNNS